MSSAVNSFGKSYIQNAFLSRHKNRPLPRNWRRAGSDFVGFVVSPCSRGRYAPHVRVVIRDGLPTSRREGQRETLYRVLPYGYGFCSTEQQAVVSRGEGYLISRTDQLSVIRNSNTTVTQNSRLCVSRDEGYLISRTDQLSVVRNSHTTAVQNNRICMSRGEDYLFLRTDHLSVVRSSHTTAAQNSNLCVSRDEDYLILQTGKTSVVRNSHTTAQISRSRKPEYSTSARVEKHRSLKRLQPEQLSTHAVQKIPRRNIKHAIGVRAQIRADRGTAKARTSRAACTAARI